MNYVSHDFLMVGMMGSKDGHRINFLTIFVVPLSSLSRIGE